MYGTGMLMCSVVALVYSLFGLWVTEAGVSSIFQAGAPMAVAIIYVIVMAVLLGCILGTKIWFIEGFCHPQIWETPLLIGLGIRATSTIYKTGMLKISSDVGYCIITALIAGCISGIMTVHEEEKSDEELKMKRADEQKERNLINKINSVYQRIENTTYQNISAYTDYTVPESDYRAIKSLLDNLNGVSSSFHYTGNQEKENHVKRMKEMLQKCFYEGANLIDMRQAQAILQCLVYINQKNSQVQVAKEIMDKFVKNAMSTVNWISFNGYGEGNLTTIDKDPAKIEEMNESLRSVTVRIQKSSYDPIGAIIKYLDADYYSKACGVMWYYACQKPLNMQALDNARKNVQQFSGYNINLENEKDPFRVEKVEEILANIYAKKQLGGEGLVSTEIDYVRRWVDIKIESEQFDECKTLASGFAWMELYKYELEILKALAEHGVQLEEEIQERLLFLENGGTNEMTIYQDESDQEFLYDSSSLEWNGKDYDLFFRQIAIKKRKFKYSLAVDKWMKTISLDHKKYVSNQTLYSVFQELTEDYDGEIVCSMKDARALDLANVFWKDAILFQFTSERCRCTSILFSCEKYGRTLNLTIITFFTPDWSLDAGELSKYCASIKNNMYVKSFRESILQTIDQETHADESIYGEKKASESNGQTVETEHGSRPGRSHTAALYGEEEESDNRQDGVRRRKVFE